VPFLPDGPGDLIGGFGVLKQLKGAPHPNAARVFMNWYASRPGQEVYSRATLEPSTRIDVKIAAVPAYVIPRPGVNYPNYYKEDWYMNMRPKVAAAIVQALGVTATAEAMVCVHVRRPS
jgi:ABC-type Fe3+ transport system substrate-binding protein